MDTLTTADRGVYVDHLCTVFGITVDEIREHLDNLPPRFAALGFRLAAAGNNTVRLDGGTDPSYDDAQARLALLRDSSDDLNTRAASTLYRAYLGTLSTRELGTNDQMQVGALTKRAALRPPVSNQRVRLTDDALYCLTVD